MVDTPFGTDFVMLDAAAWLFVVATSMTVLFVSTLARWNWARRAPLVAGVRERRRRGKVVPGARRPWVAPGGLSPR